MENGRDNRFPRHLITITLMIYFVLIDQQKGPGFGYQSSPPGTMGHPKLSMTQFRNHGAPCRLHSRARSKSIRAGMERCDGEGRTGVNCSVGNRSFVMLLLFAFGRQTSVLKTLNL